MLYPAHQQVSGVSGMQSRVSGESKACTGHPWPLAHDTIFRQRALFFLLGVRSLTSNHISQTCVVVAGPGFQNEVNAIQKRPSHHPNATTFKNRTRRFNGT